MIIKCQLPPFSILGFCEIKQYWEILRALLECLMIIIYWADSFSKNIRWKRYYIRYIQTQIKEFLNWNLLLAVVPKVLVIKLDIISQMSQNNRKQDSEWRTLANYFLSLTVPDIWYLAANPLALSNFNVTEYETTCCDAWTHTALQN